MRHAWILQPTDWISVWKFYSSLFIWLYIAAGIPLRIFVAYRCQIMSKNKMWIASSALCPAIAYGAPLAVVPVFLISFLPGGQRAVESFFMAIPIAASIGAVAALMDVLIVRMLLREAIDRRSRNLLFGTHFANALFPVMFVIVWMFVFPPEVIA